MTERPKGPIDPNIAHRARMERAIAQTAEFPAIPLDLRWNEEIAPTDQEREEYSFVAERLFATFEGYGVGNLISWIDLYRPHQRMRNGLIVKIADFPKPSPEAREAYMSGMRPPNNDPTYRINTAALMVEYVVHDKLSTVWRLTPRREDIPPDPEGQEHILGPNAKLLVTARKLSRVQ